jgi:hypothetical protein
MNDVAIERLLREAVAQLKRIADASEKCQCNNHGITATGTYAQLKRVTDWCKQSNLQISEPCEKDAESQDANE